MRGAPPAAAGTRCTCTACPLLCDDISVSPTGADRACDLGRAAFAACPPSPAGGVPSAAPPRTTGGSGHPGLLSLDDAVARAASRLAAGRRVLVTGMLDATLEAIMAACDLAETLGAAVDAGQPDVAAAAGPTIARAGTVTADWEELRDRADLVVFWACDPGATHPRFVERFVVPPLPDGGQRRTIAAGRAAVMPATPHHRHLKLDDGRAVEAARWLHFALSGGRDATVDSSLAATCAVIADAIQSASCVAFVTAAGGAEGLAGWSTTRLVREIAHRTPAFEVPLGDSACNATGAAAVCTWRYAAGGGIDRADRSGSRFLPGEATALRLIERGEVDAVLAVGRLAPDVEAAIAAAGPRLSVVRITARTSCSAADERSIVLRCADPLLTAGTMLRGDGRCMAIVPPWPSPLPTQQDVVALVHAAVARVPRPAAGGSA